MCFNFTHSCKATNNVPLPLKHPYKWFFPCLLNSFCEKGRKCGIFQTLYILNKSGNRYFCNGELHSHLQVKVPVQKQPLKFANIIYPFQLSREKQCARKTKPSVGAFVHNKFLPSIIDYEAKDCV